MLPDVTMNHIQAIQAQLRDLIDENAYLKRQVCQLQLKLDKYECITDDILPNELLPVWEYPDMRMDEVAPINQVASVTKITTHSSVIADKPANPKQLIARARGSKTNKQVMPDRNYRAVVRDKVERAAMDGFECSQCQCFYKTTGQQNLCNQTSKHKYFKPPPATPSGFWDPWPLDQG